LTGPQLAEWEAYDKIDPVGTWREDYRVAHLISTITNIARTIWHDKEKGELKLTDPKEFMPQFQKKGTKPKVEKYQSMEQMKETMLAVARAQNKKMERMKNLRTSPPVKKGKK